MLTQERELKKLVAGVEFESDEGRVGSFEVVVDGKHLAYSKVATGSFPNYATVAAEIAAYGKSGAAPANWKAAPQ
jgi:hypothetical protein